MSATTRADRGWKTEDRRGGGALWSIVYRLSVLLFVSITGCTVAGAIAGKVVGPPPVKPQYAPPKDKPMLVLVENYRNPAAVAVDGRHLALRIEEELRRYDVVPVVPAETLEAVRADPAYAKMTIPAVGRAAGAGQVLYVNVTALSVERTVGGDMLRGHAEVAVRVVDAASGATRWPTDNPAGHPVPIQTPWVRQGEGANEASLRDQMCRQAAGYIVKLFRKHSPEETIDPAVQ
jgi:hypothetical protein